MIRQQSGGPCMQSVFSFYGQFDSAVFGFSSSSVVPVFAFSFRRSISRAAFFCFFSRRAVSF